MKKYKIVFTLCFLFLCLFAFFQYRQFYDGKLHVVVCNVGQGDGIILKTHDNKLLVYDGGPDDSMLSCLSDYLPFWHRKIDVLLLSHPHNDHFLGMFSIFPVFTVKTYISETIVNRSVSFDELQKELKNRGIRTHLLGRGDKAKISDDVSFEILGPSKEFVNRTSPNGEIGKTGEFASLIIRIAYGDFSVLLTGDSQVSGLLDANPPRTLLLQVPHHGSASGLNDDILKRIQPKLAFISVGKNSYGHPTQSALSLLEKNSVQVHRTDEEGRIIFKTDGKTYTVSQERKP